MKNLFNNIVIMTKALIIIAVLGTTFYSGMYVVASKYDTGEDMKTKLMESLTYAVRDTSEKPIIMIKPKLSLYEQAKYMIVDEPEREVIEITSDELVDIIYGENQKPSFVTAAINGTVDVTKRAWNATSNGVKRAWDATSDGAKWTWDKTTSVFE